VNRRLARWVSIVACALPGLLTGCRGEPLARPAPPAQPADDAPSARRADDAPSARPADVAPVEFAEPPTRSHPVAAVATLEPARVVMGAETTFTLHVRTAVTWHIYPRGGGGGANAPADLSLALPDGVELAGDWEDPKSERDPVTHASVLAGDFSFRVRLKVAAAAAPGKHALICKLAHQACDPMMCRPPESIQAGATLEIVAH